MENGLENDYFPYVLTKKYDAVVNIIKEKDIFQEPITRTKLRRIDIQHGLFYGYCLTKIGKMDEGLWLLGQVENLVSQMPRKSRDWGYGHIDAHLLAIKGDTHGAIQAIQKAFDEDYLYQWYAIRLFPWFDGIEENPEYQKVISGLHKRLKAQADNIMS